VGGWLGDSNSINKLAICLRRWDGGRKGEERRAKPGRRT